MSSGKVGSSIQYGSYARSRSIQSIASATPQIWFASTAIGMSGPTVSRAMASRRTSSARLPPTFSLISEKPSATASLASLASFWSS